jgi:hypothetical protein
MKKNPMNHPDGARHLRLVIAPPEREDRHLIDETELQRRLADAFEHGSRYGYERGLRAARGGEALALVEALGA